MPDDIKFEFHTPTPILAALLDETDPESEPRRIFGLGHRSDFGPSPAVAELLGPRSRRDVHRTPFLDPALRATVVKALGDAHRAEFRPLPLLPEPTEVRGDQVAGPVAELGPDSATITLPAIGDRLRAFATARFAHQPLGPGAPTVVESAPVE